MFGIQLKELDHSESIKGAVDTELGVRDFRNIRYGAGIRDTSKDGEIEWKWIQADLDLEQERHMVLKRN
jgi:hypothetical protein